MHGRGESRSLSHDSVLATAEQGPTHSSHQYRILAPTIPWSFPKSRDVKEQATLEPVVPSPPLPCAQSRKRPTPHYYHIPPQTPKHFCLQLVCARIPTPSLERSESF